MAFASVMLCAIVVMMVMTDQSEESSTCPNCLDVVLVVDRSSSIGRWRFNNRIIPYLREYALSTKWTVGTDSDEYQFSVVTFGSLASVEWNWGDAKTDDASQLTNAINGLMYERGLTNIADALRVTRVQVLTGNSEDRPSCDNVCIVVIDLPNLTASDPCSATGDVNAQICQFKQKCHKVIAVGIRKDESFVTALASDPNYRIAVPSFKNIHLLASFAEVADIICPR